MADTPLTGEEPKGSSPLTGDEPKGSSLRVLVIDDSELTLDFLRLLLGRSGIETRAILELEALDAELADGWRPDAVLADVNMPDLEPGEVVVKLRDDARLVDVPIVLCSGMESEPLSTLAATCGADGFASKADGLDNLPNTLRSLCRRDPV